MVDGVVLLVDASEGPLPQTRFVLRKALAAQLPVILVVNKVDRPDSPHRGGRRTRRTDLLLGPRERPARRGPRPRPRRDPRGARSSTPPRRPAARRSTQPADGTPAGQREPRAAVPDDHGEDPRARRTRRARRCRRTSPTSTPRRSSAASRCCASSTARSARARRSRGRAPTARSRTSRSPSCSRPRGSTRVPTESAGPGDIVAVAGIEDITIGETLTDPTTRARCRSSRSTTPRSPMTIGINTSPLAGRAARAHKVTARQVKDRLDKELIGNVSLRVLPTERPDAWEVQGRGELALAILVEQMRREGFELTVGKPQVVTRDRRRQGARADGAHDHRRPRGVPRRRHAAPRAAQGPHGDDVEPRHRLGPHGVHRSRARPHRLPHPVPHRHARHRHRVVDRARLRAVGGPDRDPHQRLARRRPRRAS